MHCLMLLERHLFPIGPDSFSGGYEVLRKYKEKDPDVNIGKVFAVFDEQGRGKIGVSMLISD